VGPNAHETGMTRGYQPPQSYCAQTARGNYIYENHIENMDIVRVLMNNRAKMNGTTTHTQMANPASFPLSIQGDIPHAFSEASLCNLTAEQPLRPEEQKDSHYGHTNPLGIAPFVKTGRTAPSAPIIRPPAATPRYCRSRSRSPVELLLPAYDPHEGTENEYGADS